MRKDLWVSVSLTFHTKLSYAYKHLSVWTIPRFGHQKWPLVFRGLERSLGLENHGCIAEVEISNKLGGSGCEAPQETAKKNNIFLRKRGKKCCVFRWDSSEKTLLNAQKETFSQRKNCAPMRFIGTKLKRVWQFYSFYFNTRYFSRAWCKKIHYQFPKNIGKLTNYKITINVQIDKAFFKRIWWVSFGRMRPIQSWRLSDEIHRKQKKDSHQKIVSIFPRFSVEKEPLVFRVLNPFA